MLLENKWFGPPLAQWENSHTIHRKVKHKVMVLVVSTFSISILILAGRTELQLMLVCLCSISLGFIWRLKEAE